MYSEPWDQSLGCSMLLAQVLFLDNQVFDPSQNQVLTITMTTTKPSLGFRSQPKKLRQRFPERISNKVLCGRLAHVFYCSPGPQHQHHWILLLIRGHPILQHPVPRADLSPPMDKSPRVLIPISISHIPETTLYFL